MSVLIGVSGPSGGATLYVDGQLSDSCPDYDPGSRTCGSGVEAAFATLADGAASAQPGDEVLIRAGTYAEQLVPPSSGAPGSPITYGAYAGETVVISGSDGPAMILLDGVSYLVIEGLVVQDARWIEATDAHHNVIRGCDFLSTPASGTTGNVRLISSDHNRIEDNVLDDGNDNLLLIDSNHNVVVGNIITEGRHSVLSIRCSNFNVIRGNYFANSQQKIGEVYDCGADTSAVDHAFDATSRNLFEHNVFGEAVAYYSTSGGNGIQYAGQDGIIRRNVFYANNVGLGMQVYDDEALYNHQNRVYHNVFYNNLCAGIAARGDGVDNVFVNNVLAGNHGADGDCDGGGDAQLLYRDPLAEFFFERNAFWAGQAGAAVIQEEFGAGDTLANFEAGYPDLFSDNLEVDPAFNDGGGRDFSLQPGSPLVDAGGFLTQAISDGSGTSLPVADARFFYDGFGIDGEVGDVIQIEGQTETVTVVGVDLDTHTLTLSAPLTWTADQGVTLAYWGTAPDIGAFEVGVFECSDGLDNDNDGLTDFPDDSGCASADDTDETNCGDGVCEGAESCSNCEDDCGLCPDCLDLDGDGYGDPASPDCDHPEQDCDDDDADRHPGATETCSDTVDMDCDGLPGADDPACTEDPGDDPGGCGCTTTNRPALPLLLCLLMIALVFRDNRRRVLRARGRLDHRAVRPGRRML